MTSKKFKDVSCGKMFTHNGRNFIKVVSPYLDNLNINAVCLETGMFWKFFCTTLVIELSRESGNVF